MKTFISQQEIKEIFKEFVEKNKLKIDKVKDFKKFLIFLEIDIYDWIKENLRSILEKRIKNQLENINKCYLTKLAK